MQANIGITINKSAVICQFFGLDAIIKQQVILGLLILRALVLAILLNRDRRWQFINNLFFIGLLKGTNINPETLVFFN
jgi:hypothetical protein